MTALVPLLIRFWPYLAAAALVLGLFGYHKTTVALAHHAGYSEGESDVQSAWDAEKVKTSKAIAALASQWDTERQRADESSRQLEDARHAQFAPLTERARTLPAPDARIRVPDSAVRLLDDAVATANASGPAYEAARAAIAAAGGATDAAQGAGHAIAGATADSDTDVTIGDWAAWSVGATQLYTACRDQVSNLITFYDGLRAAKPPQE